MLDWLLERAIVAYCAVTAGVCEEILYRGFGITYVHWLWPSASHLQLIVVTSAAFGIAHSYQGLRGVVLTGRLSPSLQGWLNDHAIGGVVLFPGAGFVELAIRAGDEVGCGIVDELTLAAPLVLP